MFGKARDALLPAGTFGYNMDMRPIIFPRALLWGALATVLLGGGCTERLPWAGQGSEGFPCFEDGTCDPGLRCVADRCRSGATADAGIVADGAPLPTPDGGCNLASPSVSPEVPSRTSHMQVALFGRAPGATTLFIEGPTARLETPVVDGNFCVEVDLVPERLSTFSLIAQDGAGCASTPTMFSVAQTPPEPVNVIAGVTPYVDKLTEGDPKALTDGDYRVAATFSFWDPETGMAGDRCDLSALAVFTLPEPLPVHRVAVHYPNVDGFADYLACWKLVGTMQEDLPQSSAQWSLLAEQRNSRDAERLVIELDKPVMIRHLGLAMYENGALGLTETFRLTEIEAWSPPILPPQRECGQ